MKYAWFLAAGLAGCHLITGLDDFGIALGESTESGGAMSPNGGSGGANAGGHGAGGDISSSTTNSGGNGAGGEVTNSGGTGGSGGSGGGTGGCYTVAVGNYHTCARKSDGLYCWGGNTNGQLGDGTTANSATPVAVQTLGMNVGTYDGGYSHMCALRTNGTLWCWGKNEFGQLGDGTTVDKLTPVPVLALGADVVSVAVGAHHTCVVKNDNSLYCWGKNEFGQLGDGTVANKANPTKVNAIGNDAVQATAGDAHTCVIEKDDSLWCWGINDYGQIGDGTNVEKHTPVKVTTLGNSVAAVSSLYYHTCALLADGNVHCWGLNADGQLGDGTATNRTSPVLVTSFTMEIIAISVGGAHTCALKNDNSLHCWGYNGNGQLGDGTLIGKLTPTPVGTLGSVAQVAIGYAHTCAVASDGALHCWGGNNVGQVGDGTVTNSNAPVPILSCP